MDVINVSFVSHTTFNKIQKKYLFLVTHRAYTTNRQLIIDNATEKGDIDLLGDGSCDFLGYNARYATFWKKNWDQYSISTLHILELQETPSGWILDGLQQVLECPEGHGFSILSLTADRHKQVRRYMHREKCKINHQFDIWHVTKNIKKSLRSCASKSVLRI